MPSGRYRAADLMPAGDQAAPGALPDAEPAGRP